MRWKGQRQSEHVEDRRSMSPKMAVGGLGGIAGLVIVVLALIMGVDPRPLLEQQAQRPQGGGAAAVGPAQGPADTGNAEEDELAEFVAKVLGLTEDVWTKLFKESGEGDYREPTLVLFRDRIQSACGFQSAAVGPFYCPSDQKVYIDLGFYDEMKNNLEAPGDFAQAYVIAHEVGHHVQNLLGISGKVNALQARAGKVEANELSVRLELQADFFAGVWAHHAHQMRNILEEGDVKEALNAATAIGDDRLQMRSRGAVVPESFTHGTSEQRYRWFLKGLQTGDMQQGNTFELAYDQL